MTRRAREPAPIRASRDVRNLHFRKLVGLQTHDAGWLDALPDSLRVGATAKTLQAICDLNLAELQHIDPPRGFGRD